jgi:hypothetical protein
LVKKGFAQLGSKFGGQRMIQNEKAASAPATNLGKTALKNQQFYCNTHSLLLPIQEETLRVNFELELTQHELWAEVLRCIEFHHVTVNRPNASQIIDLTIALRELLQINQGAIEEVVHG